MGECGQVFIQQTRQRLTEVTGMDTQEPDGMGRETSNNEIIWRQGGDSEVNDDMWRKSDWRCRGWRFQTKAT